MAIYCDTSALAKRYLHEAGSAQVHLLLEAGEDIFTSAMTHLELISAIEIAKRARRITSPDYRTAFANLENDVRKETLTLLDVSPAILQRATPLIRVRRLRAPDAIQLATALELRKRLPLDPPFLCADRHLLTAASKEGLRCRDVSV